MVLQAAGHDVERVRDWPVWGPDDLILDYAQRNQRVVITTDKDFGTLNVMLGQPSAGIIITRQLPDELTLQLLLDAVGKHQSDLEQALLLRIDEHRLRIRRVRHWDE